MSERLAKQVRDIVNGSTIDGEIVHRFRDRLENGNLTREENEKSHFCAYFAAYDPQKGEVFIGHHKNSGLWLFNGGHIDEGEVLEETVNREMGEEWGNDVFTGEIPEPSLLTITEIEHGNVTCQRHFDVWYLVPINKISFNPEEDRLAEEFFEIGWKTIGEARELIEEQNTSLALDEIEKLMEV